MQEMQDHDVGAPCQPQTAQVAAYVANRAEDSRLRSVQREAEEVAHVHFRPEIARAIVRARDHLEAGSYLLVGPDEGFVVVAHPSPDADWLDVQNPHHTDPVPTAVSPLYAPRAEDRSSSKPA
jgi:hypothetical protein